MVVMQRVQTKHHCENSNSSTFLLPIPSLLNHLSKSKSVFTCTSREGRTTFRYGPSLFDPIASLFPSAIGCTSAQKNRLREKARLAFICERKRNHHDLLSIALEGGAGRTPPPLEIGNSSNERCNNEDTRYRNRFSPSHGGILDGLFTNEGIPAASRSSAIPESPATVFSTSCTAPEKPTTPATLYFRTSRDRRVFDPIGFTAATVIAEYPLVWY